ncbi:GreA/GreB family elongation factor [Rhodonellum sp.]|uniref:GreA/GreB family elongation factor n=1 Tax=Rhodonellum sp. TaxID=2231180 RepID=UPI00271AE351|nr:GreA/GreB family elongation factor [Rhodonellum sp.]MDO9552884.1 GreA/GreB family elongation factor [Rhodonellum sp.]
MKPIIKKSDEKAIRFLMENLSASERTKEMGTLQSELMRAEIVEDDKIPETVIQMGSYFEVQEISSKKRLRYSLTFPKQANLAENKLSIFSPIGVALIGFQQGQEFEWNLPAGMRKFKIEKVSQPTLSSAE